MHPRTTPDPVDLTCADAGAEPLLVRVVGVTAGLVAGGGFVGALLGPTILGLLSLADGPGGFPSHPGLFVVAAVAGCLLGAAGLPVLVWALLRDVPLGRVIVETAAGTAAGSTLGLLDLSGGGLNPVLGVLGACAGFAATAVALHLRTRPPDGPAGRDARRIEAPLHD